MDLLCRGRNSRPEGVNNRTRQRQNNRSPVVQNRITHICGGTSDRLESLTRTGVDCLSLDSKVDFGYARKVLGGDFPLMGNVDPTYALPFKRPEEVEKESRQVINKAGMSGGLILSSGCSVPAMTPPENIEAMVRAAEEGYQERVRNS